MERVRRGSPPDATAAEAAITPDPAHAQAHDAQAHDARAHDGFAAVAPHESGADGRTAVLAGDEADWSLRDAAGLEAIVRLVLAGALELTRGDFGHVQLPDPASGVLRVVAQAGLSREFVDHIAAVDDDSCACGRAARTLTQTVIPDVAADEGFRPHREIARAAGVRAVQSTPLTDEAGNLRAVVSTYSRAPGRPSDRDLRALRVFGRLAGVTLAVAMKPAAEDASRLGLLYRLERTDSALADLAETTVHDIFDASLKLAGARAATTDRVVCARIEAAMAELDEAIRQIQHAALAALER